GVDLGWARSVPGAAVPTLRLRDANGSQPHPAADRRDEKTEYRQLDRTSDRGTARLLSDLPDCPQRREGRNMMKSISILTPCYNEEANVEEVYNRVRNVMAGLGRYRYEHLFIDNCSTDRTVEILKRIAAEDTNVKLIVNSRNFGHIRSP